MKPTSVLFRLISILLFGLEIFTSFHTYPYLHGGALGVSALSWHLTNMRDGGRITTRVWNRSRSALTIVNSAGSEIARFICDTAVHHPIQSVFLIFHQSELLRTASDNLQKIPAPGAPGFSLCHNFHFTSHWEKVIAGMKQYVLQVDPLTAGQPWSIKCCISNYVADPACRYFSYLTRHHCLHNAVDALIRCWLVYLDVSPYGGDNPRKHYHHIPRVLLIN